MTQYFLKPYERFCGNVKVELDLSSCATVVDTLKLKDVTGLETEVDKLDEYKLKNVPVNLRKILVQGTE